MFILHNLSNKHCTVMDVEEEVIDILPQKCTTLQELLDLDKRLKGDKELSKSDNITYRKRRELMVSN